MKYQELAKLRALYDKLPDEEKIRRLEILAQYYLNSLADGADIVVDLTKYWTQIEMTMEGTDNV